MATASGDEWNLDFYDKWEKGHPTFIYETKSFSRGGLRNAYRAMYTMYHDDYYHGKKAVVKKMRDEVYMSNKWDTEINAALKAEEFIVMEQ